MGYGTLLFCLLLISFIDDKSATKRFANNEIIGSLVGHGRASNRAQGETRCANVEYIHHALLRKRYETAIMEKLHEYCDLHLPARQKRHLATLAVAGVSLGASLFVSIGGAYVTYKLKESEKEIIKLESLRVEAERQQMKFLEAQAKLNDLAEFTQWLDEIFVHRHFTGAIGAKAIPKELWSLMGLNSTTDIHALSEMTHYPVSCKENIVTAVICHNYNPSTIRGNIYKVHHVGRFTNDRKIFRYRNVSSMMMTSGSGTYFVDECKLERADYRCSIRASNGNGTNLTTWPIVSLPISEEFTFVRQLGDSDLVSTNLKAYSVYNGSAEKSFSTPESGHFCLSIEYGMNATIGSRQISGRHTKTMRVDIPESDIDHLQKEELIELEEIVGHENEELCKLREIVLESWLGDLMKFFSENLIKHIALLVLLCFSLVAFCVAINCFIK